MNRQNIIELMFSQAGQQALRSALHLPKNNMLTSVIPIQKINKDTISGEEIQFDVSRNLSEDNLRYKRNTFSEHAFKLNENKTSRLITPLHDDVGQAVYGLIESGIER